MANITNVTCPVSPLTEGPHSHFFGYFDKSPWSPNPLEERYLAHQSKLGERLPLPGETTQLGLIDPNTREFQTIGESRAWNLQQGAMLQWRPQHAAELLYNDIVDGEAVGIRCSTTGSRTSVSLPFAVVSPTGNEALSVNFGRLSKLKPEYGYSGLEDRFSGDRLPAGDGIWAIDVESGRHKLLLSLAQIAAVGDDGMPPEATHYINHPLYSSTGKRFSFLHRYISPSGTQHTRMLSADSDGSNLKLLISGMASHAGWRDDSELLAWAGERAVLKTATAGVGRHLPIGKMLRTLYRALGKPALLKTSVMRDRYIAFNHHTGERSTIAKGVLRTDGHCSFSPDGKWFVTDTYPDAKGNAKLFVCRRADERVYCVGEFYSPPHLDNEVRCDLHPRWHPLKPRICIDSAQTGTRQMYEVDVSSVIQD